MSVESERLSIMAQELDLLHTQMQELRIRVEQLEKAMHDLEGRYIISLPNPGVKEWTITPIPKFTEG